MDSSNFILKSLVSDKDIIFQGNDGGSEITALTLDMSEAGDATFGRNVTVTGNLTVSGTTTTVDTTNTVVKDNLLGLNHGASSNSNDSGIIIERGSTGNDALLIWDESADKWALGTTTDTASSTGNLNMTTGTLVANLEGNVTGNVTGDVTGDTSGLHTGTVRRSSSHPTFTLPSADGSAGQFLKTDGSGELAFATAVTSITLGTDTSGNYAAAVTAGTGVSVSGSAGEGTTFSVSIGQAVGTGSNVTFNQVTSGSFLYSSDETLKDDIKTIESPVEKLKQLRGVSYTWNENSNLKGKKDIGLIAQEVEKVLPELVEVSDVTNTKTINYGHLIGLLVEAVKELDKNKCECGK